MTVGELLKKCLNTGSAQKIAKTKIVQKTTYMWHSEAKG